MQPHQPNARSRASRGKLLIRVELDWLTGYPLSLAGGGAAGWTADGPRWRTSPDQGAPEDLVIDRDRLHRVHWAQRKLWREQPEGLGELLGADPARWRERFEVILAPLQAAVHDATPLPDPWTLPLWSARVQRAAGALPAQLRLLRAALGWRYALKDDGVEAALGRLASLGSALVLPGEDGLDWGLRLLGWSEHVPAAVITEIARQLALDVEGCDGVRALVGFDGWVDALLAGLERREASWPPAGATWRETLRQVCNDLAALPLDGLGRGLRLLAMVRPPVEASRGWWVELQALHHKLRTLPRVSDAATRSAKFARAVNDQEQQFGLFVKELKARKPHEWRPEAVADAVRSAAADRLVGDALLESLPALPEDTGVDLRAAFLVYWTMQERSGARLARHIRRWARTVRGGDWARLQKTWESVIDRWGEDTRPTLSPDDDLCDGAEPVVDRFYSLLDSASEPLSEHRACRLITLLAHTDDSALALAAEPLLPGDSWWIPPELAKDMLEVARFRPEGLTLAEGRKEAVEQINCLAALARWSNAGVEPRLRRLATPVLIGLGAALALAEGLGLVCAAPEAWPAQGYWINAYPEALHGVLRELAACHPRAEAACGRLLRDLAPTTAQLNAEIAALDALIGDDAADPRRIRRDRLIARRDDPAPLDQTRIDKCEVRLREAGDQAWQEGALRAIHDACRARVLAQTGLTEAPDWLLEPGMLRVLRGLPDCDVSARALARRLLAVRAGPPPWDLREDPKNIAFLKRMAALGLNMSPWLEDRHRPVSRPGASTITLSLEPDPLEIFLMGDRFGTCLSPDQCNFFSVFSNAADINKRLLVARGSNGKMVGRCLLALTDAGALLTFHAYCHDPGLNFDAAVGAYAVALAADLGTICVKFGAVSTLVSSRWYDDGPTDLAGELPFLAAGSAFRASLPSLSAQECLDAVRAALGSQVLDGRLLPLILHLDEWQAAPQAALSLLTLAERTPGLPVQTRMHAAWLADKAGDHGLARRLLPQNPPDRDLHALFCPQSPVNLELFVSLNPVLLLRILRRAEPIDENTEEVLYARGRAFEALKRPAAARRLYLACADHLYPSSAREDARERAAKLEALLSRRSGS